MAFDALPVFQPNFGGQVGFNEDMSLTIYLNNDNLVSLLGLIDEATGDYLDAATVSVTLTDNQGNTQQGPVTMTYVSGSNGNYQGILPASSTLNVGVGYRAAIAVSNASPAGTGQWYLPVIVEFRENPN
jgi:hypothetical protein